MILLSDMIDDKNELSKFELIYNTYKNIMYIVANNILKNSHDAEDVVELSAIKIISVLNKINRDDIGTTKCKNLVITIAKNTAIDFWRKKQREEIPTEETELNYLSESEDKSAESLYIETEEYNNLVKCIDLLTPEHKEILRMRILYDFSSKQIASLLNISEFNVNMRFMRAKRALSKKLKEYKLND